MNKKDKTLTILFLLTIFSFGSFFPVLFLYVLFKYIIFGDSHKEVQPQVQKQEEPYLSTAERAKIQESLKEYFEENDRLVVTGEINLRPKSGKFVSLKDLQVYYGEDCVAGFQEFERKYEDMYRKVLDLLLKFAYLDKKEFVKKEVVKEEVKEEVKQSTIADFIEIINQKNIEIEHEEISNGLYQICAYSKQIELIEKNFPKSQDKLMKVSQYYLPILVGILEDYKKMSVSVQSHEEFKAAEDKLIKTIILINEALKTICTTVCQEEFMAMNANMSTLEMLLRKDGLIDDSPFAKKVSANGK